MGTTFGPIAGFEGKVLQDALSINEGCLISVSDVIYRVEIPVASYLESLRLVPTKVRMFVAQVLREDAEILFGFETFVEREVFVRLCDLHAVGPKLAATCLSQLGVSGLAQLMREGPAKFKKVSGLGPKTMERLFEGLQEDSEVFEKLLGPSQPKTAENGRRVPELVERALLELGLRSVEIETLYQDLMSEKPERAQLDSAQLLKAMLASWHRMRSARRASTSTEVGV